MKDKKTGKRAMLEDLPKLEVVRVIEEAGEQNTESGAVQENARK